MVLTDDVKRLTIYIYYRFDANQHYSYGRKEDGKNEKPYQ